MKKTLPVSYRVWLFTWFEYKSCNFDDFETAYKFAKSSGEAWKITRLPDFVDLAQSRIPIRKPDEVRSTDRKERL